MGHHTANHDLLDAQAPQMTLQRGLVEGIVLGFVDPVYGVLIQLRVETKGWAVGLDQILPPGGHHPGVLGGVAVLGEENRQTCESVCLDEGQNCRKNCAGAGDESMRGWLEEIALHIQHQQG
jgi:hypothetical protein